MNSVAYFAAITGLLLCSVLGTGETAAAETGSIFDLLNGSSVSCEIDLAGYYLDEMVKAAETGDCASGLAAEQSRNAAIDAGGGKVQRISFDELYLLSRVIYVEAGSDWLPDDFRICVGEVVMNRVVSPEFPDTLYDVVYQKGQYTFVNSAGFSTLKPGKDCVNAALRLLKGERHMVPSVVYQSDTIQGELFSMHTDRRLGTTYFCLSENLELYPID